MESALNAFSYFAASNHSPFSSYCTVSVTVVELFSGANTPVTVMV